MRTILGWITGAAVLGIGALALWLYAPNKPRLALEAMYPGEYRTVSGLRVRLRDTGTRDMPAVILLHRSVPAWISGSRGRRRCPRSFASSVSTCQASA